MSLKEIIRITTEDTEKTYEFPGENNPPLCAVKIEISDITAEGKSYFGVASGATEKIVHLELKTLENAGLRPMRKEREDEAPTETPVDLIIRLLEHVGVYPVE